MKKTNIVFLGLAIIGITACGPSEEKANKEDLKNDTVESAEKNTPADLTDMEEVDLSEAGLPLSIFIPNNNGKPEIKATEWGSIEIRIADNFGLEIVPSGISVEERKTELNNDIVYTYNFIEDSPLLITYEQSIPDSGVEPEHHFFMNTEIAGELIEIRSIGDMGFKKLQVE